ncbi:hypothetical protein Pla22_42330 [Rubripirellula amarantea]|uniref:Uncharacterized protein n=1 Tax=Rubripirellula amarantea TaxID=2527999 RepID=A0A5C5WMQ2_9BACT|nr:hypothetical protein Pla22_42330 [Rubripirellula amarantea]
MFEGGFMIRPSDVLSRSHFAFLQQLMNAGRHHDVVVDGQAAQRSEAYPHRCVEIHAHRHDGDRAAGKCDRDACDHGKRDWNRSGDPCESAAS